MTLIDKRRDNFSTVTTNTTDWRHLATPELRAITQKGLGEIFLLSQYVYRPFTIYVTRLYAFLGWGANAATIHSALAALGAAVVLIQPSPLSFLLAVLGLQSYFVLDHVDGELARLDSWRGRRPMTAGGQYLDFWVHFHSVNLVFGALGIGLALRTGNSLWAVAGLLADNCLGNFPKLTLARTLWDVWQRDPTITERPLFKTILGTAVTDVENKQLFSGTLTGRQKAFLLAREALFFPGCLIALSLTLTADALWAIASSSLPAIATKSYLLLFTAMALTSKLRRTRISEAQLRELTAPTPPVRTDALGARNDPLR
jgi:hypothetical protein